MTEPTVSIDGKEYPCSKWEQIEQGRFLRLEWDKGFFGGMGEPVLASPDRYWFGDEWDPTSPPFLRLRPAWTASIAATNLDASLPCYGVYGKSPDGTIFMTVLNGQRSFKVKLSDNSLEATTTHAANTDLGRPALFEGTWRIPLGDTNAQADLTIANSGADTYTGVGSERAAYFNVGQDEATANLVRVTNASSGATPYLIDLSPSGASASFGDNFEIGDSSLPITDLVVSAGEIIAFKPDGPYRLDMKGQSLGVQDFVGRNPDASVTDGANSHAHGPYWYWAHSSTLWRGIGDSILPISPADDPRYVAVLSEGIGVPAGPFRSGSWSSFAAWGRWAYATHDTNLFIGFIRNDGTILWHGVLYSSSAVIRCFITAGPTLWVLDNSGPTIRRLDLQSDGSIRSAVGSARGEASLTAPFFLPQLDFGRPDRPKQLRRLWVWVDGTLTNAGLGLWVHRDDAIAEQVGSDITTTGLIERAFTIGTDQAHHVIIRPEFRTNGSYTTTDDPRIRQIGIEARTSDIWSYTIPLTRDRKDLRDLLRDLKNGQGIEIRDPDENATHGVFVLAVRESAEGDPNSADFRYVLQVDAERWDA